MFDSIRGFQYLPQFCLGLASNTVNVYSTNGRCIGYVEAKNLPAFEAGNNGVFRPVSDWKVRFSVQLKQKLGLPPCPGSASMDPDSQSMSQR